MIDVPTVRSLLSPDGLRDPYAVYDRFRDAQAAGADIGRVVVSFDEVASALTDRALSADRVAGILRPLDGEVLAQCPLVERTLRGIVAFRDPPDHQRVRGLLAKAFSPRMVAEQRDVIARMTDQLIDGVVNRGEADIHAELTFPLPAMVVGSMLGVPAADLDRFKAWALDVVFIVGSGSPSEELVRRSQEHFEEMREYMRALVSRRRVEPGDDLLSAMIAASDDDDRLSADEIFANATFLMTAGHETATNMLSNGLVALLQHPDQLAILVDDPDTIERAVDEMLRYLSPVQMTPRYAVDDGEVCGRSLRSGEALLLFLGAANRDPARFPDPGRFDVRRESSRHVAFGFGAHYCLGAPLAKQEMAIVLARVLHRLPDLALAAEEIEWQPTIDFRGPTSLPVTWRVGGG
jgi:cytochrome P450